jgi:hypothetical protein
VVFFQTSQDLNHTLSAAMRDYGTTVGDYNATLASLAHPPTSRWKWTFGSLSVLVFVISLLKLRKGRRIVVPRADLLGVLDNITETPEWGQPWLLFIVRLLIAASWEEAIKRMLQGVQGCVTKRDFRVGPVDLNARSYFGFLEFYLKSKILSTIPEVDNINYGLAFGLTFLHSWFARMPFLTGVLCHAGWNAFAMYMERAFSRHSHYAMFRKNQYFDPWEHRTRYTTESRVTPYSKDLARTPRAQAHFPPKPVDDQYMMVSGSFDAVVDVKPVNDYFWLLPTSVAGYAPARSDHNLLQVVNARILVPPVIPPIKQKTSWKRLRLIQGLLLPDGFDAIIWEDLVYNWLSHFADKRKMRRYLRALEHLKKFGPTGAAEKAKSVTVMVKTDEVLTKVNLVGPGVQPQLKPRAIANIHENVQVLLGPVVHEATKRLKEAWNFDMDRYFTVPIAPDFKIFITYAGSALDTDLSSWAEKVLVPVRNHLYVLVSGDDSLAVYWDADGQMSILEGDASSFDQSQGQGPLDHERASLKHLGVSEDVLTIISILENAPFCIYSRDGHQRLKVDRVARAQRNTGGVNTSYGNSYVMASAVVHVFLRKHLLKESLETSFHDLGLEMKLKTLSDLADATFLKGMWYATHTGWFWGPLPSRILKVGKSQQDPMLIHKAKTFEQASSLFLNDIAQSYKQFLQVPLLRKFVSNFAIVPDYSDMIQTHQVHASVIQKPEIIEDRTLVTLAKRYNVPPEWFIEVEKMYPTRPLNFVEHPLFEALNNVDYN